MTRNGWKKLCNVGKNSWNELKIYKRINVEINVKIRLNRYFSYSAVVTSLLRFFLRAEWYCYYILIFSFRSRQPAVIHATSHAIQEPPQAVTHTYVFFVFFFQNVLLKATHSTYCSSQRNPSIFLTGDYSQVLRLRSFIKRWYTLADECN